MEDYPRTLAEFERSFGSEKDCRAYLVQLRWPEGFGCPRCRSKRYWPMKRGLLKCTQCDHQASVTAGTIFHRSHLPLQTWFRAIWWVTNQKLGVSALGIQRLLGLGSYETAWACLQKLRRAMVRPGRDRLTGEVEVDETYVGGVEPGKMGRERGSKALVAVAAQVDGKGIGRIRLRRIPDASAKSLETFVKEAVEKYPAACWGNRRKLTATGVWRTMAKHEKDLLPRDYPYTKGQDDRRLVEKIRDILTRCELLGTTREKKPSSI